MLPPALEHSLVSEFLGFVLGFDNCMGVCGFGLKVLGSRDHGLVLLVAIHHPELAFDMPSLLF